MLDVSKFERGDKKWWGVQNTVDASETGYLGEINISADGDKVRFSPHDNGRAFSRHELDALSFAMAQIEADELG